MGIRARCSLLVLALLSSGCVSNEGAAPQTAGPTGVAADTGVIRGLVTNTELQPIQGAVVTVPDLDRENATAEDGTFVFPDVPAGSFLVVVKASGYDSRAKRAEVRVAEESRLEFRLEALPVREPYSELFIHRGFSNCQFALWYTIVYVAGTCNSQALTSKIIFRVEADANWSFAMHEIAWETDEWFSDWIRLPLTASTQGYLIIRHGPSPLRIGAFPGQAAVGATSPNWNPFPPGPTTWENIVYYAGRLGRELNSTTSGQCNELSNWDAGCVGVGPSLESAFDLFVTLFYHEPPPDPMAYTAVPD